MRTSGHFIGQAGQRLHHWIRQCAFLLLIKFCEYHFQRFGIVEANILCELNQRLESMEVVADKIRRLFARCEPREEQPFGELFVGISNYSKDGEVSLPEPLFIFLEVWTARHIKRAGALVVDNSEESILRIAMNSIVAQRKMVPECIFDWWIWHRLQFEAKDFFLQVRRSEFPKNQDVRIPVSNFELVKMCRKVWDDAVVNTETCHTCFVQTFIS